MYSFVQYTGNGVSTDYAVPFPYLDPGHVDVSVNGVSVGFSWVSTGLVRLNAAPANGSTIRIRRDTSRTTRLVDYGDATQLDEATLDKDSLQAFYMAQEALDQNTIGAFFTTDAAGARVTNVANAVNPSDATPKSQVESIVNAAVAAGGGGGGGGALGSNNNWTGLNTYSQKVTIGGVALDPATVTSLDLLSFNKGIYVDYTTNHATAIGYAFASNVRRFSGNSILVAAQLNSHGQGAWIGSQWSIAAEAVRGKTSFGITVGVESSVVNANSNDPSGARVGLDVVFKNRQDGATTGGDLSTLHGVAGDGLGGNRYNANSWAIQISSQTRSDAGATYVGWSRGVRYRDWWCDLAKVSNYDAAVQYTTGDQVYSGGNVYQCVLKPPVGTAPPNATYWTLLETGTDTVKAVGIDFSGVSQATADNMKGAIKLRGLMPILWDTEAHISTSFDVFSGRWVLKNDANERFAVDAPTGDVWLNGARRVLATASQLSAHRASASVSIAPNAWATVICTTEEFDARAEHNVANGRFQPNTAGTYLVTAQVQSEGSPVGTRLYSGVFKNGAASPYKTGEAYSPAAAAIISAPVTCLVQLNGTTDYIELRAFTTGSTNVGISGLPEATYFQVTRIA